MQNAAPRTADVVLLVEITMGIALVVGAILARRRRYRAHAWCQSTVVVLNLVVIGLAMAPSFYIQVMPKIQRAMRRPYYALAAGHAVLGAVAELVGIYVVVSAGTNILPNWLRLREYRVWMRATFILWWVVLLLGVATYARWYLHT